MLKWGAMNRACSMLTQKPEGSHRGVIVCQLYGFLQHGVRPRVNADVQIDAASAKNSPVRFARSDVGLFNDQPKLLSTITRNRNVKHQPR